MYNFNNEDLKRAGLIRKKINKKNFNFSEYLPNSIKKTTSRNKSFE